MERKKKTCNECKKLDYIFSKGRCKKCSNKAYAKKSIDNKRKKISKTEPSKMGDWYKIQISIMPKCCEECGKSLAPDMAINKTIPIAHIIPKSSYPSVAAHPLNVLFLCGDHHTNYDNKGADYRKSMKINEKATRRGLLLYESLTDFEKMRFEKEFGYILK